MPRCPKCGAIVDEWIECAEEMPDADEAVFAFIPESYDPVQPAYLDGDKWFDMRRYSIDFPVTHWMPYPEPPKRKLMGFPDVPFRMSDFETIHEEYSSDFDACLVVLGQIPGGTRVKACFSIMQSGPKGSWYARSLDEI